MWTSLLSYSVTFPDGGSLAAASPVDWPQVVENAWDSEVQGGIQIWTRLRRVQAIRNLPKTPGHYVVDAHVASAIREFGVPHRPGVKFYTPVFVCATNTGMAEALEPVRGPARGWTFVAYEFGAPGVIDPEDSPEGTGYDHDPIHGDREFALEIIWSILNLAGAGYMAWVRLTSPDGESSDHEVQQIDLGGDWAEA